MSEQSTNKPCLQKLLDLLPECCLKSTVTDLKCTRCGINVHQNCVKCQDSKGFICNTCKQNDKSRCYCIFCSFVGGSHLFIDLSNGMMCHSICLCRFYSIIIHFVNQQLIIQEYEKNSHDYKNINSKILYESSKINFLIEDNKNHPYIQKLYAKNCYDSIQFIIQLTNDILSSQKPLESITQDVFKHYLIDALKRYTSPLPSLSPLHSSLIGSVMNSKHLIDTKTTVINNRIYFDSNHICNYCYSSEGVTIPCMDTQCTEYYHPICYYESIISSPIKTNSRLSTCITSLTCYDSYTRCKKHNIYIQELKRSRLIISENSVSTESISKNHGNPIHSLPTIENSISLIPSIVINGEILQEPLSSLVTTSSNTPLSSCIVDINQDNALDEDICDVCRGDDSDTINPIVYCSACGVGVHKECYGIQSIPEDDWFCDVCTQHLSPKDIHCVICDQTSGAFKHTVNNTWIHSLCCLFTPELYYTDQVHLTNVDGFKNIDASRTGQKCCFCNTTKGTCCTCRYKDCMTTYHPICGARGHNLFTFVELSNNGTFEYISFCKKHTQLCKQSNSSSFIQKAIMKKKSKKDYKKDSIELKKKKKESIPSMSSPRRERSQRDIDTIRNVTSMPDIWSLFERTYFKHTCTKELSKTLQKDIKDIQSTNPFCLRKEHFEGDLCYRIPPLGSTPNPMKSTLDDDESSSSMNISLEDSPKKKLSQGTNDDVIFRGFNMKDFLEMRQQYDHYVDQDVLSYFQSIGICQQTRFRNAVKEDLPWLLQINTVNPLYTTEESFDSLFNDKNEFLILAETQNKQGEWIPVGMVHYYFLVYFPSHTRRSCKSIYVCTLQSVKTNTHSTFMNTYHINPEKYTGTVLLSLAFSHGKRSGMMMGCCDSTDDSIPFYETKFQMERLPKSNQSHYTPMQLYLEKFKYWKIVLQPTDVQSVVASIDMYLLPLEDNTSLSISDSIQELPKNAPSKTSSLPEYPSFSQISLYSKKSISLSSVSSLNQVSQNSITTSTPPPPTTTTTNLTTTNKTVHTSISSSLPTEYTSMNNNTPVSSQDISSGTGTPVYKPPIFSDSTNSTQSISTPTTTPSITIPQLTSSLSSSASPQNIYHYNHTLSVSPYNTPSQSQQDTINTPSQSQQDTIITPSLSQQDIITTPSQSQQDTIITPSQSQQDTIITPSLSQQDTIITPSTSFIPISNPISSPAIIPSTTLDTRSPSPTTSTLEEMTTTMPIVDSSSIDKNTVKNLLTISKTQSLQNSICSPCNSDVNNDKNKIITDDSIYSNSELDIVDKDSLMGDIEEDQEEDDLSLDIKDMNLILDKELNDEICRKETELDTILEKEIENQRIWNHKVVNLPEIEQKRVPFNSFDPLLSSSESNQTSMQDRDYLFHIYFNQNTCQLIKNNSRDVQILDICDCLKSMKNQSVTVHYPILYEDTTNIFESLKKEQYIFEEKEKEKEKEKETCDVTSPYSFRTRSHVTYDLNHNPIHMKELYQLMLGDLTFGTISTSNQLAYINQDEVLECLIQTQKQLYDIHTKNFRKLYDLKKKLYEDSKKPDYIGDSLKLYKEFMIYFKEKYPDYEKREEQNEQDAAARCFVCGDDDSNVDNAIVFCDGCNVAIHQLCYNINTIPEGDYFCDVCRYLIDRIRDIHLPLPPISDIPNTPIDPYRQSVIHTLEEERKKIFCCICGYANGAMMMTRTNKWCHVSCALWLPDSEVEVERFNKLEKGPSCSRYIINVKNINPRRSRITCIICKRKGGCVQCCYSNCCKGVHLPCALKSGYDIFCNNKEGFNFLPSYCTLEGKEFYLKCIQHADSNKCIHNASMADIPWKSPLTVEEMNDINDSVDTPTTTPSENHKNEKKMKSKDYKSKLNDTSKENQFKFKPTKIPIIDSEDELLDMTPVNLLSVQHLSSQQQKHYIQRHYNRRNDKGSKGNYDSTSLSNGLYTKKQGKGSRGESSNPLADRKSEVLEWLMSHPLSKYLTNDHNSIIQIIHNHIICDHWPEGGIQLYSESKMNITSIWERYWAVKSYTELNIISDLRRLFLALLPYVCPPRSEEDCKIGKYIYEVAYELTTKNDILMAKRNGKTFDIEKHLKELENDKKKHEQCIIPTYMCICQVHEDKYGGEFMIECEHCKNWIHPSCIGWTKCTKHPEENCFLMFKEHIILETFYCPLCIEFGKQNITFNYLPSTSFYSLFSLPSPKETISCPSSQNIISKDTIHNSDTLITTQKSTKSYTKSLDKNKHITKKEQNTIKKTVSIENTNSSISKPSTTFIDSDSQDSVFYHRRSKRSLSLRKMKRKGSLNLSENDSEISSQIINNELSNSLSKHCYGSYPTRKSSILGPIDFHVRFPTSVPTPVPTTEDPTLLHESSLINITLSSPSPPPSPYDIHESPLKEEVIEDNTITNTVSIKQESIPNNINQSPSPSLSPTLLSQNNPILSTLSTDHSLSTPSILEDTIIPPSTLSLPIPPSISHIKPCTRLSSKKYNYSNIKSLRNQLYTQDGNINLDIFTSNIEDDTKDVLLETEVFHYSDDESSNDLHHINEDHSLDNQTYIEEIKVDNKNTNISLINSDSKTKSSIIIPDTVFYNSLDDIYTYIDDSDWDEDNDNKDTMNINKNNLVALSPQSIQSYSISSNENNNTNTMSTNQIYKHSENSVENVIYKSKRIKKEVPYTSSSSSSISNIQSNTTSSNTSTSTSPHIQGKKRQKTRSGHLYHYGNETQLNKTIQTSSTNSIQDNSSLKIQSISTNNSHRSTTKSILTSPQKPITDFFSFSPSKTVSSNTLSIKNELNNLSTNQFKENENHFNDNEIELSKQSTSSTRTISGSRYPLRNREDIIKKDINGISNNSSLKNTTLPPPQNTIFSSKSVQKILDPLTKKSTENTMKSSKQTINELSPPSPPSLLKKHSEQIISPDTIASRLRSKTNTIVKKNHRNTTKSSKFKKMTKPFKEFLKNKNSMDKPSKEIKQLDNERHTKSSSNQINKNK
ncbi:hypothetical protein WA158_007139 [Blastocystis sp. Blastoise]